MNAAKLQTVGPNSATEKGGTSTRDYYYYYYSNQQIFRTDFTFKINIKKNDLSTIWRSLISLLLLLYQTPWVQKVASSYNEFLW